MITGTVDEDQQAIIQPIVVAPDGREHAITAIVDTGYTGALARPPSIAATLRLPFRRRGQAILADDTTIISDVQESTFTRQL